MDGNDFIDDEVEVSGDEGSSDESDQEDGDSQSEVEEEESEPKEQQSIRRLQLQQQLDNDDEEIEGLKQKLTIPEESDIVEKPSRKKWSIKDLKIPKKADNDGDVDEDESEEEIFDARQFIEREAELSGDEASSDEEEDENDDIVEADEVDPELPGEDEQREDILRVQMKQDLDDDLRDVREIKNMLFADGDLYREGLGPRKKKFKWKEDDDEDNLNYKNVISFNSDAEESEEDDGVIAQVKINYKLIERSEKPLEDQPEVGDEDEEEEEVKDDFESIEMTRFEGAFGGPAGSILSYVIRDRATHEKLTDQKGTESLKMSRTMMKRKKLTRRGPPIKTLNCIRRLTLERSRGE